MFSLRQKVTIVSWKTPKNMSKTWPGNFRDVYKNKFIFIVDNQNS